MARDAHEQPDDQPQSAACTDVPWECTQCGALLAWVDAPTRTRLRFKYKDFYLWVDQPRTIGTVCRSCGAFNQTDDDASTVVS